MNSLLLRKFLFPFYHGLKKTGVMERLNEARYNQWLSHDELISKQKNKLSILLKHAYKNVHYYRSQYHKMGLCESDFENPQIIQRLPLLSKKDVNIHRDSMISDDGQGGRLIRNSTSGSTGQSLYFFTDMNSWAWRRAIKIRNHEWLGVNLGDKTASLWGARMDIEKTKQLRGFLHRLVNNYIILSSYELSKKSMMEKYHKLMRFKPVLLVSYPGPLTEFSEFMLEKNLKLSSIKAIISSAETLFSWQKTIIESAFQCPVFNRYGCREFGDIAHECENREGLHVNIDRVFVEILDKNLCPCPVGKKGEIVITDLDNFGMPLIRYRIGDIGSFSDKICSCGRGLPLLESIDGRTLDVVRAPNGNALGGTFWTLLFKSRPGIASFQVIQKEIHGVEILYVAERECELGSALSYFMEKIHEKCGSDFNVKFTKVDEIEKTKSGKTRFVVSKISKKMDA